MPDIWASKSLVPNRQGQQSIIQPPHLAITSVVGWDAAVGVAAELGGLAANVEATLRSDGDGECIVFQRPPENRIRIFLGLSEQNPLGRRTGPAPAPDPCKIKQK
jgi:hypothetical protein